MPKKKKSYIPVGRIKKHLRRLSFQRPEYAEAKNREKVDTAIYKCEECDQLMYDGKSTKNFEKKKVMYPNIIWQTPELDHDDPVIEPKRGFASWDDYLDRLFCAPEDLTVMCKKCHKKESDKETEIRVEEGTLKRKK